MMYKYHTYSFVCIIIVVHAVPINHEGLCWKRYSEDKRLSLSSLKGVIIFCILKLLRPRAKTNDIVFNVYYLDEILCNMMAVEYIHQDNHIWITLNTSYVSILQRVWHIFPLFKTFTLTILSMSIVQIHVLLNDILTL